MLFFHPLDLDGILDAANRVGEVSLQLAPGKGRIILTIREFTE